MKSKRKTIDIVLAISITLIIILAILCFWPTDSANSPESSSSLSEESSLEESSFEESSVGESSVGESSVEESLTESEEESEGEIESSQNESQEQSLPVTGKPSPESSNSTANSSSAESSSQEEPISAKHIFIADLQSSATKYVRGTASEKLYPASITKLFTAYTALQWMEPDEVVTAGDELDLVSEGSSIAYILKGHQLTVDMLVEAMLLPSGNDAAHVIAAAAGRRISGRSTLSATDAIKVFVDEMNRQAQDLGLWDTHFMNPDGFHDENHYTSMQDLLMISRLSLQNEIISYYAGLAKDDVVYASGQTNSWLNSNALLHPESPQYRPDVVGLKTGHTDAAGWCLLTAVRNGSSYVIIGVFGCETMDDRAEEAMYFIDHWRDFL